jgi:hypothetical protein
MVADAVEVTQQLQAVMAHTQQHLNRRHSSGISNSSSSGGGGNIKGKDRSSLKNTSVHGLAKELNPLFMAHNCHHNIRSLYSACAKVAGST